MTALVFVTVILGFTSIGLIGFMIWRKCFSQSLEPEQVCDPENNPENWILAVERDEEIDLDDLDKKIEESGYLF